ncbi:hypothetical protein N431DRAFT_486973 [Stipitochalara longipes BDJ]|nr:hypothetical protein N431DRAFT_486973 [Stipitochalara longipes BDJ]
MSDAHAGDKKGSSRLSEALGLIVQAELTLKPPCTLPATFPKSQQLPPPSSIVYQQRNIYSTLTFGAYLHTGWIYTRQIYLAEIYHQRRVFLTGNMITEISKRADISGEPGGPSRETHTMNEIDLPKICAETPDFSSSTEAKVPRSFINFPRLPIELRSKIWSFALSDPRVVEFEWHGYNEVSELWKFCSESALRSPVLFRINKEAREEFMHYYRAIRPQGREELFSSGGFFPDCYFNPDVDTLYLTPRGRIWEWAVLEPTLIHLDQTIFEDLRYIAIQLDEFPTLTPEEIDSQPPSDDQHLSAELKFVQQRLHALVRRTPKLVELSVVLGDYAFKALRHNTQAKKKGIVEFASLVPSDDQPYLSSSKIENLRSWFSYFINYLPRTSHPVVSIKQVLRGGELVKLNEVDLFTYWEVF